MLKASGRIGNTRPVASELTVVQFAVASYGPAFVLANKSISQYLSHLRMSSSAARLAMNCHTRCGRMNLFHSLPTCSGGLSVGSR